MSALRVWPEGTSLQPPPPRLLLLPAPAEFFAPTLRRGRPTAAC